MMLDWIYILSAIIGRQAGFESPPNNSVYSSSIMPMPLKPGLSPAYPAQALAKLGRSTLRHSFECKFEGVCL